MDCLGVTGLDVRVELRLRGDRADELDSLLRQAWSRCLDVPAEREGEPISLTLAAASPAASQLTRGGSSLSADEAERLMVRATQSITGSVIAAQAGNLLMFHAGSLSHPATGASVVFVAPGGTGKTTLCRTLGRHYGYLTDETVGIEQGGRIMPYPKPLSIRTDPTSYHKNEHSPDELGLAVAHPRPYVARVILLARDDHHKDVPEWEELPLLDAIAALAPETSSLSELGQGLRRCAELIDATGPVLRVRYSEAESLTGLVADLIGGVE